MKRIVLFYFFLIGKLVNYLIGKSADVIPAEAGIQYMYLTIFNRSIGELIYW